MLFTLSPALVSPTILTVSMGLIVQDVGHSRKTNNINLLVIIRNVCRFPVIDQPHRPRLSTFPVSVVSRGHWGCEVGDGHPGSLLSAVDT